jgi:serine/threonine protein kinase
VLGAQSP